MMKMTKMTKSKRYTIGRMRFRKSTMVTIWDEKTQEPVFDIISHEVPGGIKEANKIIKQKLKELEQNDNL